MEPWASQQQLAAEGDCGISSLLVPSPQSEAVTHEMEELSLQPTQSLPPLNERKNVLQLRLQQRRTREQLVDQGIMPPLKSPAAFHGQIRSLERARTENFLKHKIRSRPERAELVRMHILQETGAEPSLQATQMKLKRARLADNLNEKIAQRPGPMELVEKNILPVASSLKEAIIVGQVNYPKVLEEDGCYDAVSPEQPASQESQGSAPSPGESRVPETPPPGPAPPGPAPPCPAPAVLPAIVMLQPLPSADFPKPASANEQPLARSPVQHPVQHATPTAAPTAAPAASKPGPTLVKQSQQKSLSEKSRSKKGKEAKSRMKKLKYHQYVPPDQKQDAGEPPMDSSYARLLQQQQLFLQLQILSQQQQQQQQQHYNYQTILPAPLKPVAESQSSGVGALPSSIVVSLPTGPPAPPTPPRPNNLLANRKPGVLPANLDEMKVAELKLELKLRGLPVSGTKTDLIERLKPFQENSSLAAPPGVPISSAPSSVPMEVSSSAAPTVVLPVQQAAPERMCSTPPNSPIPSDPAALQPDISMSEAEAQPGSGSGSPRPEERDRRLHEKQRQIEDLMRKLEREQRLVEELKMQLEVEKRGQADPVLSSSAVKMEGPVLSSCSSGATVLSPQVVKLEDVTLSAGKPLQLQTQTQTQIIAQIQNRRPPAGPQAQPAAPGLQQFFISHPAGVLGQPQTLMTATGQTTTQIFVPVSLPNSAAAIQLPNSAAAIQLPNSAISLQPVLPAPSSGPGPGLVQNPLPQLQSANMEVSANQQPPLLQTLTLCSGPAALGNQNRTEPSPQRFLQRSPESRASPHTSPNHQASNGPLSKQTFVLQPSREPPRYEDAVKQSRSLQAASQVPTATSQHMDDLFDILVESGEIPPFLPQDAAGALTKTLPVTASVTTLPVGSALSRSPPQVQLGPPVLDQPVLDGQLEAFLERTLAETASDPRTRGLMEELRSQLADPFVPMDTTDPSFSDPAGSALGLALFDSNLDSMEWLDGPGPPGPAGFPAEFLEPHDMQLHFD
ncbi:LOW QUALITY PROTEIN: myocardin-related transcription factor B [Poeciliopsis prolifica]|uniref:LOW QUALITY PROTEIN: myocardin-related transcription factor B n=1 Tax=Poeciliopsis prolifica TaxID=188132 RepID=UPI002413FF18|nr:LOW QUALITY PROTEIN: myocardin-related transcription factor B [Poeciliopsis prolifica]